ncbi:MAG TPA: hypothetical protein PK156_38975 [Polyangium sp.]|nr:hypothetical protein [Polyangium sp.]
MNDMRVSQHLGLRVAFGALRPKPLRQHLGLRWIMIATLVGLPQWASAQSATAESAQNVAIAQKLYDDAMQLMAEKKYAEACPKLAESNRLDTGMGTRFYLGDCYENLGRVASAWALFTDVADEAKRTNQAGRESVARQRATQLEVRLPKMTLQVPPSVANVPGVEVRDGDNVVKQPLWGQPLPVDPGKHTIAVRAPGRRTWEKVVDLKEGAAETVVIGELVAMGSSRHTGAIVLGSVGVASIVVGSVFGIQARSKWQNEVVLKSCNGGVVTQCDLEDAKVRLEKSGARTDATISTVTFLVGGAALAGAAVLALWPRGKQPEGPAKTVQLHFVPVAAGGNGFFAMGLLAGTY